MIRPILVVLLGLCAVPAHADERILEYHSEIAIAADTTMTVTETIRVRAEGQQIRRGIYRDFPTAYRDRHGRRVNVLFEPIDATRDGNPENWRAERQSNGVRVYFGSENVFLDHGEHTYVFRYRTARQLGFFEEHDELYWNVTGNGWGFAIERASATVTLPGHVDRGQVRVEGYTGVQGSTARDYAAYVDAEGRAWIAARGVLAPENGLTVVVAFPKGVVIAPDLDQRLHWFALDNRREALLAIGLLILVVFLYAQWRRVGRDPPTGVIMPLYDPPPGLSAAAARYVRRMAYDDRCFAADVVELGIRGALNIRQDGKSAYTLERAASPGDDVPKSARVVHAQLLGSRSSLILSNTEHAIVGAARKAHDEFLKDTYAKANFRRNDGIGCLGMLLGIATIVAALILDSAAVDGLVIALIVAVSILCMLAVGSVMGALDARHDGSSVIGWSIAAVILAVSSVIPIAILAQWTSVLFAVLVAAISVVQVPFGHWMRAPTVAGRKLLDQLEGLRLYLSLAERDDLSRAKAPPMTVDEYQRLLPYALALNVEKTWGDRLATAIGPAAVAAAATGMAWYHGSATGNAFDASRFGSALGSSLSSAISSSSSPPGSSSGGGGGGSSGGGGGGGGGGGW